MSFIPSLRASNPFDRAGLTRVGHVTRGRIPGPSAGYPDPGSLRKLRDVRQAWELARARYLDKAIQVYTTDEFWQAIHGEVDPLLLAVGNVCGTELVGPSSGGAVAAYGLGVGSTPITTTGSRLGSDFSRGLLDWMGLGALSDHLAGHLYTVGATLERGIRTAWHSGGAFTATHTAAHDMADAFGIFFGLVHRALLAAKFGTPDGAPSGALLIPVATILQSTRPPELADKLDGYLQGYSARLMETSKSVDGTKDPLVHP